VKNVAGVGCEKSSVADGERAYWGIETFTLAGVSKAGRAIFLANASGALKCERIFLARNNFDGDIGVVGRRTRTEHRR